MSLEADGGIPCRPNPAATLLIYSLFLCANKDYHSTLKQAARRALTHQSWRLVVVVGVVVVVAVAVVIQVALLSQRGRAMLRVCQ